MTSEEAKQALKEGKVVRHKDWYDGGFLKLEQRTVIVDDKGDVVDNIFEMYETNNFFQDEGWEIVDDK